jgi:regulator of sigma D
MKNCEELEDLLRQNPTNEKIYEELIEYYQNNFRDDSEDEQHPKKDEIHENQQRISQLREQYLQHFIPLEDFWLSWILDTIININKETIPISQVCRPPFLVVTYKTSS